MGLEVSGVYGQPAGVNNTPSRQCESTAPMRSREPQLMSVETVKIDAEGRVGRDGRLKAGDQIVAIDGRPVSQMSILRTRAYIEDLQEKAAPTLTVARPISSFAEDVNGISDGSTSAMSSQRNLVLSALQHANTSRAIGQTTTVNLTKSNAGFGFTVTGRETAQGEGLLYIGTVKPNGVALGHLRAGGRLLEINGENIRNDAVGGGREQIAAVLWNFCESLLHGGAADKDGRLRVDDRLVGIERIRLDKDSNDVASKKISGCFKALGSSTDAVRIIIQRKYGIFAETSLLLDHHHHEAMHSVTATPSPISLRFSQSSDDKRSSITSDITRADNLEPTPGDAFDPNHIKLFQDIKHQRQTSAPPMSSRSPMTSSFHGYAQRFTAGGCSCPQSIGLSPFPSSRSFTAAISCAPFTVKCQ